MFYISNCTFKLNFKLANYLYSFICVSDGAMLNTVQISLPSCSYYGLTAKWSRSNMGTNWEGGLVIRDVTGDGLEDIVYAGGGSDIIYVLNGNTGATIYLHSAGLVSIVSRTL